MRKVELLAPAGNFDCLKAAINNGADAVYLGGKNFSARAFANNFDEEELIEAIKYAHLRNVKIYVTLNTLLNEKEFKNAIKIADFYYRNNVDALLIQDLGLFYYLKEKYPDFELHCSTQMHVHNIEGVKNAKKLGFKRVVLARESNIETIKEACKQGIEIETFVHGAICVSYSGQCLMSSFSKSRSANKGMCAQCCRLRYDLLDEENNKIETDSKCLLSPADMFLLNDIPELIDAGVSSFKIEGRMKSAAYVGYTVRLYRKAIDSYLNGKKYIPSEEEINNLKVLFNRNFTNDLLYSKSNIFNQKTPNHLGIEIGEVIKCSGGYCYIKLNKDLHQFDGIRIGEYGCIVNKLYKDKLLVNSGNRGDIVYIETDEKLSGKVYKTVDSLLEKEIGLIDDKKLPLDLEVNINPDVKAKVKLKCYEDIFEYESDLVVEKALKSPLNEESITKQFSKLNDTEYYLNSISVDTNNAFLGIKQLNDIRRQAIIEFNEYRLNSFKRVIIPNQVEYVEPTYHDSQITIIKENDLIIIDYKEYKQNYVINVDGEYIKDKYGICSEFGSILLDYESKIADYTLNCCNSYAYEFLKKLGFDYIVLSSELKNNEIEDLINEYKIRNNVDIIPCIFVKGKRVLMYIKTNPFDKYMKDNHIYHLSDGKNKYLINKAHNITELIEENYIHEIDSNIKYIKYFIR